MAQPTNVYLTYAHSGMREDVIDVITNIDPVNSFVMANTGNTRATNMFHEWLTDVLPATITTGAIQGNEPAASAVVPPTRLGNYVQTFETKFIISDLHQTFNAVGGVNTIPYQTALQLKGMANTAERAILLNTTSSAGSSVLAAYMKGMDGFISTNCVYGGASVGASVTLSEGLLNTCLQAMWEDGGDPKYLICGGAQKILVDSFSTNTREIAAASGRLVRGIDIYKGSLGGMIGVIPHRHMSNFAASKVIILGQDELWSKAWAQAPYSFELGKTGAHTAIQVDMALTIESRGEAASGKIVGLKLS